MESSFTRRHVLQLEAQKHEGDQRTHSNGEASYFLIILGNPKWEAFIVSFCRSLRARYLRQSPVFSLNNKATIFETSGGITRWQGRGSASGVGPRRDFHFPMTWVATVLSPAPPTSSRIIPRVLTRNWTRQASTIHTHLRFIPRMGLKTVEIPATPLPDGHGCP